MPSRPLLRTIRHRTASFLDNITGGGASAPLDHVDRRASRDPKCYACGLVFKVAAQLDMHHNLFPEHSDYHGSRNPYYISPRSRTQNGTEAGTENTQASASEGITFVASPTFSPSSSPRSPRDPSSPRTQRTRTREGTNSSTMSFSPPHTPQAFSSAAPGWTGSAPASANSNEKSKSQNQSPFKLITDEEIFHHHHNRSASSPMHEPERNLGPGHARPAQSDDNYTYSSGPFPNPYAHVLPHSQSFSHPPTTQKERRNTNPFLWTSAPAFPPNDLFAGDDGGNGHDGLATGARPRPRQRASTNPFASHMSGSEIPYLSSSPSAHPSAAPADQAHANANGRTNGPATTVRCPACERPYASIELVWKHLDGSECGEDLHPL